MRRTLAALSPAPLSQYIIFRYTGTGKFQFSSRTPETDQEEESILEKQVAGIVLALLISYAGSLGEDEKAGIVMAGVGGVFHGCRGVTGFIRAC